MIKSKEEKFLINVIGWGSSAVSYAFTILMLMSFAQTKTEKVLYFLCGLINDGAKWFCLITVIKYSKAKLYKSFTLYGVLFLLFAGMSMIASISYSIYTVQKQMYDITITENQVYKIALAKTEQLKLDLEGVKNTKASEMHRINTELDSMPLDWLTRRKELADKKIEVETTYDTKINNFTWQLNEALKELEAINNIPTETKKLKNNSVAGFFQIISNVTNTTIDTVIMIFAVALGAILDIASIALTFDSANSYTGKRDFNKDFNSHNKLRDISISLKKTGSKAADIIELDSYNKFKQYVENYKVDLDNVIWSDLPIKKSSFYKFKEDYEKENQTNSDFKTAAQ